MNKKLIICIPSLRLGGAAKVALNLTEYFRGQGTAVSLILTDSADKELEFGDVPAGTSVITLKRSAAHRYIKPFIKMLELYRLFKKIQPDAILAVRHDATAISSLAWKMAGKPGAFFIREINPITKTLDRNAIMIKLVRAAYQSADGVIANSKDVLEALRSKNWMAPAKIHAVDNPVISKTFFDKAAVRINDQWLNASANPLFITIGRLDVMKDHATMIRAFAKVKAKRESRLLIIGEGKERSNLEALIASLNLNGTVKLAGAIENPYPYLKHADVFVLSSVFEGFGNVLVEALSLGKKVVSTNCIGGPAHILDHGTYGKLVPVGDVDELANAMFDALEQNVPTEPLIERSKDFFATVIGEKYSKIMFDNINV